MRANCNDSLFFCAKKYCFLSLMIRLRSDFSGMKFLKIRQMPYFIFCFAFILCTRKMISKKNKKMIQKFLKQIAFLVLFIFGTAVINAQSYLKKKEKEAYECGYVYKPSFFNKLKPMKIISGLAGNLVKSKAKSDLSETSIAVIYASNMIPNNNLDFVTKTEGWETCGEGVSVVFFNNEGIGLTDTDGDVIIDGQKLEEAGMGTYFQGYPASKRGKKKVEITSSSGDKVEVNFEPLPSLEILTVNGKKKNEDIIIDGTEDVIIELKNGDLDKDSQLYVEIIVSAMSLKAQTHLFISDATNKLVIPKEAFTNFEQSPLPIIEINTLSVSRVKQEIIYNTQAGPIQKVTTFSDFVPVLLKGDIAGGSLLTNTFSKDKNTKVDGKFKTIEGEYNFQIKKENAFKYPPIDRMKKIGIASFVVRGNLFQEKTTVSEKTDYNANTITTTTTTIKKWFPEISDAAWQKFADKMYNEFVKKLKSDLNVEVINADKMVNSKMYKDMKPILDTVTKTFVEKGAYGTKRFVNTGEFDSFKDFRIIFPDDSLNEKLMKELGIDGLVAVTIDLDFDLKSEGLNPTIKIVAFAPNVSYRMPGTYFELDANTKAKKLSDANQYNSLKGGPEDVVYKVMKADDFFNAFTLSINEIRRGEKENPAYEKIWKNRAKRK